MRKLTSFQNCSNGNNADIPTGNLSGLAVIVNHTVSFELRTNNVNMMLHND